MSDKGIIFSAPMVRALLDGRKTQTRRLLTSARVFATPESQAFTLKGPELKRALQGADRWRHLGGTGWFWEADAFDYQAPATRTGWMAHLPYAPGDRLYVREAWKVETRFDDVAGGKLPRSAPIYHLESPAEPTPECAGRYRQGRFMPRWASRLTLLVTDVRVQRLQDIRSHEARAEGLEWVSPTYGISGLAGSWDADPRTAFAKLWNSLHDKPGERWEDNPWIVAVTFDVKHGNIDRIGS